MSCELAKHYENLEHFYPIKLNKNRGLHTG